MFMAINWLAILLAAVASYVVGALWYSPLLFGAAWERLMGYSEEKMAQMRARGIKKIMLANFVLNIITATVVWSIGTAACTAWSCANVFALFAWFGFMVPIHAYGVMWEAKPFKLFLINIAYSLLSLLVITAVLSGFAF
jgi:hypothetical protein